MEKVLQGLGNVEVYLDSICLFAKTWEEFLLLYDKILSWLETTGFTVNPFKWEWAVQETNWIGYWLTLTLLKPWKKHFLPLLSKILLAI